MLSVDGILDDQRLDDAEGRIAFDCEAGHLEIVGAVVDEASALAGVRRAVRFGSSSTP